MTTDPTAAVAEALHTEGLPLPSAEKFAHIAVDTIRLWLWQHIPCTCDPAYTDRDLADPGCTAHDTDLALGGDGSGEALTPERARERLALSAARLRDQYGEDVYQRVFAPWYAEQLARINGRGKNP